MSTPTRSTPSRLTRRRLSGAALAALLHVPYVAWAVAGISGLVAEIAGVRTIYGLGSLDQMSRSAAITLLLAVAAVMFVLRGVRREGERVPRPEAP